MYIYTFWLRMTDAVTSQNIDLSSWNTLYSVGWYGAMNDDLEKDLEAATA
jgi:hypothetical protein